MNSKYTNYNLFEKSNKIYELFDESENASYWKSDINNEFNELSVIETKSFKKYSTSILNELINNDINYLGNKKDFLDNYSESNEKNSLTDFSEDSSSLSDSKKINSQKELLIHACSSDTESIKSFFLDNLLKLIQENELDYGYRSQAEDFVREGIDKYDVFAKCWINDFFLNNFDNSHIASSVLRIISHFNYEEIYPEGVTMAVAATRHCNIEVQDCGIRCFENWESPANLPLLKNLTFTETWLSDYLSNVIRDLEGV